VSRFLREGKAPLRVRARCDSGPGHAHKIRLAHPCTFFHPPSSFSRSLLFPKPLAGRRRIVSIGLTADGRARRMVEEAALERDEAVVEVSRQELVILEKARSVRSAICEQRIALAGCLAMLNLGRAMGASTVDARSRGTLQRARIARPSRR
jgi:hypothetical protein